MGTTTKKDIAETTQNPVFQPTWYIDTVKAFTKRIMGWLDAWRRTEKALENYSHHMLKTTCVAASCTNVCKIQCILEEWEKVFIEKSAHAPSILEDS